MADGLGKLFPLPGGQNYKNRPFLRVKNSHGALFTDVTSYCFRNSLTNWLLVLRRRWAMIWVILTSNLAPTPG